MFSCSFLFSFGKVKLHAIIFGCDGNVQKAHSGSAQRHTHTHTIAQTMVQFERTTTTKLVLLFIYRFYSGAFFILGWNQSYSWNDDTHDL